MRKKNFKGRCTKKRLSKAKVVVKLYDAIQSAYADVLQADEKVKEIRCNVLLDGLEEGEYTSDFVCIKESLWYQYSTRRLGLYFSSSKVSHR